MSVCLSSRDLMDRLVDEAEGLAVESSSSVASGGGGGGGRMEQATDQQLSLLNSITASDLTGEWTAHTLNKPRRFRESLSGGFHLVCGD